MKNGCSALNRLKTTILKFKVVLGILGVISGSVAQQSFVQQHGQLSVKGNQIVDKNSLPITLRGMSLYCWSYSGTQYYNANAINWLCQDWKCTVIRIPILPAGYQSNSYAEISRAKTVIDACIAKGIYAIVDWHSMDGAQNNIDASKRFFTEIATAYGNTPNVLYETWNEPMQESWDNQIKPYHEAIIRTIRTIDSDNIIICGTRTWSQDVDEASGNPISISSNIAYTLHFYAATHKQYLRDKASVALKNGIALVVTEWGTSEASGSGQIDAAETGTWWTFMNQNNISHANWSLTDLNETSAALQQGASSNGNWSDNNLTASGRLVRSYLIGQSQLTKSSKPEFSSQRQSPGFFNSPKFIITTQGLGFSPYQKRSNLSGRTLLNGRYFYGPARGANCYLIK